MVSGVSAGQVSVFKPGENLVISGVPAIQLALLNAISPYQESVSDSLLGWESAQEQPIMLRQTADVWTIGRVSAPGRAPEAITHTPEGFYDSYFQRQAQSIIFRVDDSGGSERTQLYHYDIKGKKRTLLTDGKSRNLYPVWSNSGEWILYSSTRRNGKDLDIYAVKPIDPKSDHIVAELKGEDWAAFDWSPDDRRAIISDYRSTNESYLWILDIETGRKTLLTPKSGGRVFNGGLAQFSRDGRGVFHLTNRDSEFQRLAYIDIASGRYTYLTTNLKWDVEEFTLSHDRKLIAFTTNETGISRLHLMNADTGQQLSSPEVPVGIVSGLKWHNLGKKLAFVHTSTTSPGDIYAIDISAGKLERWTENNPGSKSANFLAEPQLIQWKSFDIKTITGFLYRPPQRFKGKRPVIIDIHGGPYLQYRPGFRGPDNYFTSELGAAMIYPNIRGSSGYGKSFLEADDGAKRDGSYRDIGSLLDWIKTQPDLDSERVVVRGLSSGANVALAVAAMYPTKIRGAIAKSGPTNIATFLKTVDPWFQDRWREEFGDERVGSMLRYLNSIAPVKDVSKIKRPIFIVHGMLDGMVPVSEAEQMISAAKVHKVPYWSILIKNEGHGIADAGTSEFIFASEVLFIQNYLLDS